MGRIVQLSDELSNKIAAGEVVERPASVVKELLENSVDAKSSWIKVELEEAGLKMIKVIDDGDGIDEDDVEKAFFRHATSKITNEFDLFRVKTLGFRGEALASIASVSHLTLRTSTGEKLGTEVTVEGGVIKDKQRSAKRKGTEIIVENLFFNTPARLKYLKTEHTELGHITDVINKMAISHPTIRIECHHNGKRVFFSPGTGDLLHVIRQIYGHHLAKNMLSIKNESLDYHVSGLIAKPEVTRSNRNYMTLIVNGRYIKNPVINKAILEGYHTFLPIGRFPVAILQIEMDPYLVDVNVHPAKTEVRFSKEKELYQVVKDTIYKRLHEERLIPSGVKIEKEKSEQTAFSFEQPIVKPIVKESNESINQSIDQESNEYQISQEVYNERSKLNETYSQIEYEHSHVNKDMSLENDRMPVMYPIGQLHGTYILAQNEKGLYMIDQHAAQERIKYEYFKEKLGQPENEVQELSVPLTFEFTSHEALIIEKNRESFESIGLFLEPFGNHSYIIRSHPSWFPNGEEEQIIRDMVDELIDGKNINLEKIREEAAILMACKRSIKANHYLNHAEMEYLLNELRLCQNPFTCPHGRPIIIHFSEYELQKMFKRIM